jgi:hypothetical protein
LYLIDQDVIEEIIGSEILDETDVFVDVAARVRISSAVRGFAPVSQPSNMSRSPTGIDETTSLLGRESGEADQVCSILETSAKKKKSVPAGVLASALSAHQYQE